MTRPDPIFVDLHGRDPDPQPFWKAAWQGTEPLWKVFWVYFLFGHGIIIGVSLGVAVISMVLGFAVDPGSLKAGLGGLSFGLGLLLLALLGLGVWSVVAIWKCAYNCRERHWGHAARAFVVLYASLLPTVLLTNLS